MSFLLLTRKYLKRIFFTLFVFIILVIFVTGLGVFTYQGNNFIFNTLQKFEPRLTISLNQGSLFYSPVYEKIRWADGDALYEFNDLSYEFDWNCLIEELCLESLTIASADINIPETETPAEPEDPNAAPFVLEFPLRVNIKDLAINNTHIKVAGVEIDLEQLLLKADGQDNNLALNTSIKGLTVILADVEVDSGTKTSPSQTNQQTRQQLLSSFPAILTDKTLPEIILPVNLTVKQLDMQGFKLIQNKKDLVFINQLNSQFTFFGSKLAIEQFALDLPEADLAISGDIDLSQRYPMDLAVQATLKEIKDLQPTTLLKGQKLKLNSQGNLADLQSSITLSELINAKIDSKVDLYSENLPHQLTVKWEQFNWPLSGKPEISSNKGYLASKGTLNNYQLQLDSHLSLTDLPPADINLMGEGNLQSFDLSTLMIKALQGDIQLNGNLNWLNNLAWKGDLSINGINFNELSKDYPGQLSGHIQHSVSVPLTDNKQPDWAFNLPVIDLKGSYLKRPLTIKGKASGDANQGFSINNLAINNAENSMLVNGKVTDKNDLSIDLDIQNLTNIIVDSRGKIKGKVNLAGSIDKIEIDSNLSVVDLSYLDNDIEALSIVGQATLSELPVANLAINANNIQSNGQQIESIKIGVKPNAVADKNVQHQVHVDLKSKIVNTDLTVLFEQQLNSWSAILNKGVIETVQGLLVLKQPFTVTTKQQTINLTAHCWLATNNNKDQNGQLCIKKFSAGENGDIEINIDDFLLSSLTPFIPDTLTLEGALAANVDVFWKNNQKPSIDLVVNGDAMALNINTDKNTKEVIRYPVEQFYIEMKTGKQQTDFSVKALSEGLINANVEGYITPYQTTPEINATLDLLVPDFDNFAILIPQVDKLTGQLQANIKVKGKLEKPSLAGQVLIADASIKAPSAPLQITDLNAKVDIDDNQAKIDGYFFTNTKKPAKKKSNAILDTIVAIKDTAVSTINIPQRIANMRNTDVANKETNGRADINGLLDWNDHLKGKIHFEADQMLIQDYGKIELYVSPNIDVVLDDHVNVNGVINVNKGNITVKELPEGAVSVSKDVIVVDAKEQETSADLPVKMNVKVSLGDQLRLQAIGLDSYIHGDLIVKKELKKELTVNGELTFSEGSYKALAQQLVLQNSRIVFQGQPDAPYLNIEAIRDPNDTEDNVTAGVRVTGTPDQLQLTIFSEPAMSQQNALSYITRGYSIANASSDSNNNQLASILIDLGAGQTDGVMGNIGKSVGIDDLSLASSGQGDQQSVGIKGTIAPGVEISYGVGVFDSFTIFAIRYELFKQFYIEASSGLYQAVDAYYEWDWD